MQPMTPGDSSRFVPLDSHSQGRQVLTTSANPGALLSAPVAQSPTLECRQVSFLLMNQGLQGPQLF